MEQHLFSTVWSLGSARARWRQISCLLEAPGSLCPHVVLRGRGFPEGTDPIHEGSSLMTQALSKHPPPYYHSGVRVSTHGLQRDMDIQSATTVLAMRMGCCQRHGFLGEVGSGRWRDEQDLKEGHLNQQQMC